MTVSHSKLRIYLPLMAILLIVIISCLILTHPVARAEQCDGYNFEQIHYLDVQNVTDISWSPDGAKLAVIEFPNLNIFSTETWQSLYKLSNVPQITWSADSSKFASVMGGIGEVNTFVWNANDGQVLHKFTLPVPDDYYKDFLQIVHNSAWSPDSQVIASDNPRATILLWDLEARTIPTTLVPLIYGYDVITISWSPDGEKILTGAGSNNGSIDIWDSKTGEHLLKVEGNRIAVWSPDGNKFAGANDSNNEINIRDANTGNTLQRFKQHSHAVAWIHWSPDSEVIISKSWQESAKIWNPETGLETTIFGQMPEDFAEIYNIVWDKTGRFMATVTDDNVIIWQKECIS